MKDFPLSLFLNRTIYCHGNNLITFHEKKVDYPEFFSDMKNLHNTSTLKNLGQSRCQVQCSLFMKVLFCCRKFESLRASLEFSIFKV